MYDSLKNSAHFTFNDVLNITGFVIGLFGLLWGFYTWNEGKKKDKLYNRIFDAAANSLKTDETEAELKTKQSELSKVSEQFENIRKTIPIEARRAIIIDKLHNSKQTLHSLYTEITSLQIELTKLDSSAINPIPKEFYLQIQNLIEPKFLIKERIDNLKTTLTILSTLASISFAVVPGFGDILGAVFSVMAAPVLLKLVQESYKYKEKNMQILKLTIRIQVDWVLLLLFVGILLFTLYLTFDGNFHLNRFTQKAVFITNIIAPCLIIFTGIDLKRHLIKKRNLEAASALTFTDLIV